MSSNVVQRHWRAAWLAPCVLVGVVACGGGGGSGFAVLPAPSPAPVDTPCAETGPYACKTGETEPLYTFQWALHYAKSWFTDNADAGAYGGGIDLNVEPVHRMGIKGQGVNVLVADSGVDLEHEDLRDNAAPEMSWNFETDMPDPNPRLTNKVIAHGTLVAGVIGAAQNGKGVMGIAPQVRIGGAVMPFGGNDAAPASIFLATYGGAPWSRGAHVINASFGDDDSLQSYTPHNTAELAGIRSLKALRDGKGVVFVKAAGNAFLGNCGALTGAYDCSNPANDPVGLEPNAIMTAALNAKGQASSYSSAGSVVWITGFGGEYGSLGRYGEESGRSPQDIAAGGTGEGPVLFSTDIRGCDAGYSQQTNPYYSTAFLEGVSERVPGTPDNANCDYGYVNGTSAAAPSISGVVALMLSANPALSWRDVRDILRLSARQVDDRYELRVRDDFSGRKDLPYNALFDLRSNSFVAQSAGAQHIAVGATQVPVELGWVRNAAGLRHSNWYGFGLPDATKAVELALLYKKEPARSRSATQVLPAFEPVSQGINLPYQQVSLIGEFLSTDALVDQFQLRLTGEGICLGSMGLAVESPSGTKSLLKMPLDHFANKNIDRFEHYGAGSYAFYGESAKGVWKIYALASNPEPDKATRVRACDAAPPTGEVLTPGAWLNVEARVIAQ